MTIIIAPEDAAEVGIPAWEEVVPVLQADAVVAATIGNKFSNDNKQ